MFKTQNIEVLLDVFNVSKFLNVSQFFQCWYFWSKICFTLKSLKQLRTSKDSLNKQFSSSNSKKSIRIHWKDTQKHTKKTFKIKIHVTSIINCDVTHQRSTNSVTLKLHFRCWPIPTMIALAHELPRLKDFPPNLLTCRQFHQRFSRAFSHEFFAKAKT